MHFSWQSRSSSVKAQLKNNFEKNQVNYCYDSVRMVATRTSNGSCLFVTFFSISWQICGENRYSLMNINAKILVSNESPFHAL